MSSNGENSHLCIFLPSSVQAFPQGPACGLHLLLNSYITSLSSIKGGWQESCRSEVEMICALAWKENFSQQVEFNLLGKREFYLNFKMYCLTLRIIIKKILLQSSTCQHLPSESILVHLRVLYRRRATYFSCLPTVNIPIAHSMPSAMSYFFPLLYNECLNLILHSTWNLFLWKWQKAWDSDCCCSFCWLFDKWQRVWVFWDLVSFQFTKGLIQNLWRQQKSCCLWIGP